MPSERRRGGVGLGRRAVGAYAAALAETGPTTHTTRNPKGPLRRGLAAAFGFMKGIVEYLSDHDWSLYAAGLAFYGLISLTPFVVLAVAVGGAVFGDELARSELHHSLEASAGLPVADLVAGFARDAGDVLSLSLASLFAVIVLLWSSTNLFTQVRSALHEVWGIEPPEKTTGGLRGAIRRFFRYRLFAAVGTFVVGAMFLALLAIRVGLDFVEATSADFLTVPFWVWDVVEVGVSLAFVTVFVRIVYRLLPDMSPPGKAPWIGAFVTAVLLVLGRTGLAVYLSVGTVGSAYGTAAALVVFLGWAYWSALSFLFGARLAFVLASRWGKWPEPQTTIAPDG